MLSITHKMPYISLQKYVKENNCTLNIRILIRIVGETAREQKIYTLVKIKTSFVKSTTANSV